MNVVEAVLSVIALGALFCLYILPSWIAADRNHPQFAPILIINLAFGWTLLGWIGALAWSVSSIRK